MENPIKIAIHFMSSKDNYEDHVINSKNDNIEIRINYKADEVQKNFFNHFFPGIKFSWKHP